MKPKTERLENLLTGFYLSKEAEGRSKNPLIAYHEDFAHSARWYNGPRP